MKEGSTALYCTSALSVQSLKGIMYKVQRFKRCGPFYAKKQKYGKYTCPANM